MANRQPIGLSLLPLLGLLGVGIAYYSAAQQPGDRAPAAPARLALELGGAGALGFWLALRLSGFGVRGGLMPGALAPLAIGVAAWALALWPLAAWRLERLLRLPPHRSHDAATHLCGLMLLGFLIVGSASVALHYLTER